MSDVNKVVAAILTAGRVPTMSPAMGMRPMEDWLAEYQAWLTELDKMDQNEKASKKTEREDRILNRPRD